jgi:hypothetical protein
MEAIIGFAIGYWAGTRDGREGITKALAAFDAITKSDEFKNIMGQGLALGGSLVSKSLQGSGGNALAQGVFGVVADRAGKILAGGLRAA